MLAFATFRVSRIDAFLQIAIGLLWTPAIVDCLGMLEARLRSFKRFRHAFARSWPGDSRDCRRDGAGDSAAVESDLYRGPLDT